MNDRLERVPSIPGRELMRRSTEESVLHAVDVHTAGAEAGRGAARRAGRVAADEDIHTVEDAGVVHHRLRVRRHHLLTRCAEHDDTAWRLRAREILADRDR